MLDASRLRSNPLSHDSSSADDAQPEQSDPQQPGAHAAYSGSPVAPSPAGPAYPYGSSGYYGAGYPSQQPPTQPQPAYPAQAYPPQGYAGASSWTQPGAPAPWSPQPARRGGGPGSLVLVSVLALILGLIGGVIGTLIADDSDDDRRHRPEITSSGPVAGGEGASPVISVADKVLPERGVDRRPRLRRGGQRQRVRVRRRGPDRHQQPRDRAGRQGRRDPGLAARRDVPPSHASSAAARRTTWP